MSREVFRNFFRTWARDITSLCGLPLNVFVFVFLMSLNKIVIAVEFLLAIVLSLVLSLVIRYFYFRARPGNGKIHYDSALKRLDDSSFPSIHASKAMIMAVILSQGLPLLTTVLIWYIALIICGTRIYLKKHYPTDVLGGVILGLFVSYLVIYFVGLFV
ncbi:MAG: phosphatase PAP2 family protein [Candidatus Aenigmarchaeota archaeon]|nr:phosphatase PAP2 family protein [Candidatus Aenigmarchaeota archaeon]